MGIFYTEFTLPQNIGAFTVINRPVSFCLVFHYAFDNFLHRKPKHRPASFPPPHSTFVTAKVCRMDLKMRENIPTPVHATAPQFFRYPLRLHPIQDTARLHGIPSHAGPRQERNRKTEQTGNTKPEKRCNTRENRKIELLLLRKNRFSRHRRQTLKASNTATDHHQATERPPEIAQSPPQTAKSHSFSHQFPHKQQNPIGFSHHFPHFRTKISEIIANIPHQRTLARIF